MLKINSNDENIQLSCIINNVTVQDHLADIVPKVLDLLVPPYINLLVVEDVKKTIRD